MVHCHELKNGQVLVCADCGLELTVSKECTECGTEPEACGCAPCQFVCCEKELTIKK